MRITEPREKRDLTGTLVLALLLAMAACGTESEAGPESQVDEAGVTQEAAADPEPQGDEGADTIQVGAWAFALAAGTADADPAPVSSFPHDPHGELSCRVCHDQGDSHRTHGDLDCAECHAVVPTESPAPAPLAAVSPEECQSCHHDPDRGLTCAGCHTPPATAPNIVSARFSMVGGSVVRERSLSFDHDYHTEPACGTCHRNAPAFAVTEDCASCHEDHHRADADCGLCHSASTLQVHDGYDHSGCGGSGCHGSDSLARLTSAGVLDSASGRTECLVCHRDESTHEREEACAPCHFPAGLPTGARSGSPEEGGP